MHEFSIATSIMERVLNFAEDRGIRKILEVRLAIGELTCVETEQLQFCFSSITAETPLAEAVLTIETMPAVVLCPACSYHGAPKYWDGALSGALVPTLQCPACGLAAQATEGHECSILSIKYMDSPQPISSASVSFA
jgi:hydrogenase nickel incorporation protein HypA/HybF